VFFHHSRDQEFFHLLRSAAENAVEEANLLNQLLLEPHRFPELGPKIKDLESRGDRLTHDLFALINKTFVTPLEREDLAALGVAIDSVVDAMESAAARIGIYKVKETDKFLKGFGNILRAQAGELVAAIDVVAGGKLAKVHDHVVQINFLENQADELHRSALSQIFEDSAQDPVRFITMKEIYEYLEEATDRAEDAADTLEGVAMKNA